MKNKRIIIVDDEAIVQIALQAILDHAGYIIYTASNGQEALQLIQRHLANGKKFDLLLTDIKMPIMDGLTLIDKLNGEELNLPVIAMTGCGDKDLVIQLLKKGCKDYIEKPFKEDELLSAFAKVFMKEETLKIQTEEKINIHEKEKKELDREFENYRNHFNRLDQQVKTAVDVYQKLVDLNTDLQKVNIVYKNETLADLGGDFIDAHNTDKGCDFIIADVAGHDLGASFHTVLLKAFFEENCKQGKSGESFFNTLNDQLIAHGKYERMVTAQFFRIDLEEMTAEMVVAGHPPLILLRKNMPFPLALNSDSSVLGIFKDIALGYEQFDLSPGDRFFFFTDGILDASSFNRKKRKNEKLGVEGLNTFIQQHRNLSLTQQVENIWEDIWTFCRQKPKDDMLFVGIEIP